jgi:hypothetical protein
MTRLPAPEQVEDPVQQPGDRAEGAAAVRQLGDRA